MPSDRIILIGFMGTGKTETGKMLAQKLGFEFIDTDILIEELVGKTIPQIFADEGEAYFRIQEKKILKSALQKTRVIISTGGGAVVDEENLKLIKKSGLVIGLTSEPEVILKRTSNSTSRPLLQDQNRLQKIKDLLAIRAPYYAQADKLIDTTTLSIKESVEEILKHIS